VAKRASLSFDAVKASKAAPPAAAAPEPAPEPAVEERRGRGRPAKRPADEKIFGMTLRVPGNYRRALRRLAEDETDDRQKVVSVHDVILEAIDAHLARKGVKLRD
jgi:hypothetical protein